MSSFLQTFLMKLIFLPFESIRLTFLNPIIAKINPGRPAPVPMSNIDEFFMIWGEI